MPLEIQGQAEAPKLIVRDLRTKNVNPASAGASLATPSGLRQGYGFGANRRGIIAHWDVPRPFANAGLALSELGLERYSEAVKEYYQSVSAQSVEMAKYAYARWVVRRMARDFETQLRKFQRHPQYKNGWYQPSKRAGETITPEEFFDSWRWLVDFDYVVKCYQVKPELQPLVKSALVAKLRREWELK